MGFHIPSRIDSASFPRSGFRRGRKTQAEVFAHRTWSVPDADLRGPLELSSAMQSGSVLRRLYLRPQPHTATILPGTKDSYTHPTTPSAGRTGGVLTCLTIN